MNQNNLVENKPYHPMNRYLVLRKGLKDKTINAHRSRYNKMVKFVKERNCLLNEVHNVHFNIIEFNNLIKEFLLTINLPSRTSYISTIMCILAPISKEPKPNFRLFWEYWKDYYYIVEHDYRGKDQTKSIKQRLHWMDWKDIIKLRNKLKKKFMGLELNNKIRNNYKNSEDKKFYSNHLKKYLYEYQNYLMLNLHTYIPPVRTEYSQMIIISLKDFRNLSEQEKYNNVYLTNDLRTRKIIIFGKNSRKNVMQKELVIDVPRELCNVINTFIDMRNIIFNELFNFNFKCNSMLPFLIKKINKNNKDIRMMSENTYSHNVIYFFEKMTGKKIGVSLLRSIFVSHYRKNEVKKIKKQEICTIMNHSLETQENEYLKHD